MDSQTGHDRVGEVQGTVGMSTLAPHPPSFAIRTSACEATRSISIVGELDLAVAREVALALDAALTEADSIVVDLHGVDFIDSAGVHLLMHAKQHADERSVRLAILPAGERLQRIFRLCGVDFDPPIRRRRRPAGRGRMRRQR
jgi:anti-sigma B factor antagonist